MKKRTPTITLTSDRRGALRAAGKRATARSHRDGVSVRELAAWNSNKALCIAPPCSGSGWPPSLPPRRHGQRRSGMELQTAGHGHEIARPHRCLEGWVSAMFRLANRLRRSQTFDGRPYAITEPSVEHFTSTGCREQPGRSIQGSLAFVEVVVLVVRTLQAANLVVEGTLGNSEFPRVFERDVELAPDHCLLALAAVSMSKDRGCLTSAGPAFVATKVTPWPTPGRPVRRSAGRSMSCL